MTILISFLLFVLLAGGLSVLGMKLWVKPKEAMERVAGTGIGHHEVTPRHPSLVFHDIVKRLGNLVPASPKDVTVMQRRLIRAGYRNQNALKILYGAKALFGVLIPVITGIALLNSNMDSSNKFAAMVAAVAIGFFGPNEYVRMVAKKRQKQIHRGLANALDLLVVCVESGLGLDQAILQVAKELEHAHPEITEELAIVNLELKAGKRRAEALRNLADRTAVEDLKKLVAVLIQADRFGTGVAQSLRAHSDYMRVQARQIAEEKAAKLGVKLVFPIFFCILPSLFVVTVGPVVMRIIRQLLPMMNNV
ncbi:MAG TPA: type II secretion system F family protein [Bryobacteraceae bacterium]|nr:type II secretion system F family protein [Bryobacteraceae bacterium]